MSHDHGSIKSILTTVLFVFLALCGLSVAIVEIWEWLA